jgi:ring-1,2-phenylacetyl-CoA epoxidase subunit PaaC
MTTNNNLYNYLLMLGDNNLILGQRMGEWCGHGPVLEQDIAMTNIALDLIGQSRMLFQYAAKLKGDGTTEDSLAFVRQPREYLNCQLVEQPNGNFGHTIMRQFLFDAFNYYNYMALKESNDETIAAIAAKSFKEVSYHLRFSSEWAIRLGDGTEVSRDKMQTALDDLWRYTGELYTPTELETSLSEAGIAPDFGWIESQWKAKVDQILMEATLKIPEAGYMQSGGKKGIHTEHHGFILAELQYMQRTYPDLQW